MRANKARCGTPSGYNAHQRRGEQACDLCAAANREYNIRNRSAPEKVRKNRLNAKAQARAHSRLVRMHPGLYAALYAEEKARVYKEAGVS